MKATTQTRRPPVPKMEGWMARWYTQQRGSASQLELVRKSAERFAAEQAPGADALEIAPGPGYHAVELARRGLHVTALDISRSFIEIASAHARKEAVSVEFRLGDAAKLPFENESFDLIVCQAAFKNFLRPAAAIAEMHRVLRAGGTAVIEDLRQDATFAEIETEVAGMRQNPVQAAMTTMALMGLRRRAYTPARFHQLVADSPFGTCDIDREGIGMAIRMTKQPA
jgi:ubiquinone/menaquinone biosynthesis C-methylase UbiE